MTGPARYRFGDALELSITAPPRLCAHLAREYADHAIDDAPGPDQRASVLIGPGASDAFAPHTAVVLGRHKLARWRVTVEAKPAERALRLGVSMRGPLAPMLVQSMVIEPALGLAAPWCQSVVVPGAAFLTDAGAILIAGPARTGKSTLAARLAASRADALADDLVVVWGEGRVSPVRRRVRLYDDFADNAPQAHARLPARLRGWLRGRGALRKATLGMAAPPLLIPPATMGIVAASGAPVLRSLLVVAVEHERGPGLEELHPADAVPALLELGGRERSALHGAEGHDWEPFLQAQAAGERDALARILTGVRAQRLYTPAGWDVRQRVRFMESVLRDQT